MLDVDEPFVYVMTAGDDAIDLHTRSMDDIKNAVKEMLWDVIQYMDDTGEKLVYNDMLNITLRHYKERQYQQSLLTEE